jgi:hypothetical protein
MRPACRVIHLQAQAQAHAMLMLHDQHQHLETARDFAVVTRMQLGGHHWVNCLQPRIRLHVNAIDMKNVHVDIAWAVLCRIQPR